MREVRDDLGRVIRVPTDPRRLVSLVPSLSETLWWWHLADRLVAVTDYCVAPPSAFRGAVRVRGTKNPDVERIVGLDPDVVIANEEENRHHDVERLEAAGIAVYVTRVRTVSGAADTLAGLGDVLGQPAAGLGLRQALLRALDQARLPKVARRCLCPIWRDGQHRGAAESWWLVGGDTFAGDLLAHSGFAPASTDLAASRYPRHRLDELAQLDPDVVLLPDEPYAFGHADAEVFASWRARVRYLDGTALSWWGPRTPDAIGDLARLARQLTGRRSRSSTGASWTDTIGSTTVATR